jgi:hypothetical protein
VSNYPTDGTMQDSTNENDGHGSEEINLSKHGIKLKSFNFSFPNLRKNLTKF